MIAAKGSDPRLRVLVLSAQITIIPKKRWQMQMADDQNPTTENEAIKAERDALRETVVALWDEYSKDDECDYVKINGYIEEAAEIVANAWGGYDQLDKAARALRRLAGETNDA